MPSPSDWGMRGVPGFQRDTNNEQVGPLPANGVFTGQWTRVDNLESFLILYGTHVPFTMLIQWSKDGIALDTDPFTTISPQVRSRLGLYSVISPQSTFFRPFYRLLIANGPSAQLFAISDSLLLRTQFTGYDIDVDGPIPVLGLARLGIGLQWGRNPTGWQPFQLTAANNQKVALAENLLGDLPVDVQSMPGSSYSHIAGTGTTVIKNAPGILRRIVCNDPSLGVAVMTMFDSVTAPGPLIAVLRVAGDTVPPTAPNQPVQLDYNVKFATGLTVAVVGANDFTVVYD